jgi:hypothetical protein
LELLHSTTFLISFGYLWLQFFGRKFVHSNINISYPLILTLDAGCILTEKDEIMGVENYRNRERLKYTQSSVTAELSSRRGKTRFVVWKITVFCRYFPVRVINFRRISDSKVTVSTRTVVSELVGENAPRDILGVCFAGLWCVFTTH